jgi:hypothetical protein
MTPQVKSGNTPTTLAKAQEWLDQWWPGTEPSGSELHIWHELRCNVFVQVAESDPEHRHEALALAHSERRLAAVYSSPDMRLPALLQLLRNQAGRTRCNPRVTVVLRDRAYEIERVRLNQADIVIQVSES